MKPYEAFFKGKRTTILGLGVLGRGVGDAEFLAKCGAEILVTDKKSETELAESVAKLKKYRNITFKLGGHDAEDFRHCDMVLKAAGVPLDSKEIAAARDAGIPIVMSTALFAKYAMEAGVRVVGVTGTRGKSTVAHMIHHVLIRANKKVVLGGNIRGISTLAMLPDVHDGDIAVLELDSWQLQGFGDLKISPHVGVFMNLMPDHQNYYSSMDEYFADKANIFAFQKPGDVLFAGSSIVEKIRLARPPQDPIVPEPLPREWKLHVLGEHNRENASFAAAALQALGISDQEIKTGLESFMAVEGRLQIVREVRGVKIYNDNNATTPEATIAAIQALSNDGDTISIICLIVGGSEKGLALDDLITEMKKKNVSHVILLTHPNYKGSERLAGEMKKAGVAFDEATDLAHAVEKGMNGMKGRKGALLFSPAFASFGMFKNEYERNDRFLSLVRSLQ